MPAAAPITEHLAKLTDVIDALRDEIQLLESQLDRDEEGLRFEMQAINVELELVVTTETNAEGKAEGKVSFKVPAIGGVELGGGGSLGRTWGNAVTQRVSFALKPRRLTKEEREERARNEGTSSEPLLGGGGRE